jgi:hypothetical protein
MSVVLMMSWRPSDATIQCYSCTSGDAGCDDPFSASGITTTNCLTSCSKSKSSAAGIQAVVRGCGAGTSNTCTGGGAFGVSGSYCECTTDLCNTAAPVVTVTSLVGLTAVAVLAAAVARALWATVTCSSTSFCISSQRHRDIFLYCI